VGKLKPAGRKERNMATELTKDIIRWDIRSWSKVLTYWDLNVDWEKIQNGLELGSHEGGLSLWLALKGKSMVCSDLNDVKATAEPLHRKYKISSFVQYQDIDAANIPYHNYFDIIVFKSIIGGIGRNDNVEIQRKVFKEIHKALKPGGKLLFAENLIASAFHQRLRKRFVNWGSSWRYVSIEELQEFMKDFSSFEIKTTGVIGTFGRNERQRSLLSAIDGWILNKICPAHWKYISFGIAEK
jgi:SAM-dependent methyltransferase